MKNPLLNIRPHHILRGAIYSLYAILLISFVTGFLPSFRYTAQIPDLMLCATVAIAFFEGERTAAVFGVLGGFALESAGSHGVCILPCFYLFCAICASALFRHALVRNYGAFMLYMCGFCLLRALISIIYIQLQYENFSLASVIKNTLFGEWNATVISATPIFFITKFLTKKLRADRDYDQKR